MSSPKDQVRIELTADQKANIRNVTGKDAEVVELSVEELEERIAPATVIPKPPTGRYRRQMKQRLNKHYGRYGQRWQVECTNSLIKRRLTTTVQARSYWAQCRELLLIVLTYQCMLVLSR